VAEERWSRLSVTLPTAMADWVGAELVDWGSPGVEVVAAEGLAAGRTTLLAYYPEAAAARARQRLDRFLERLGPQARPWEVRELEPVPPVDWANQWRFHFPPLPVGERLIVVPPWERSAAGGRLPLVLQPGMAFGTGRHPSTVMVLEALERLVPLTRGPLLDMGCGSGILAIGGVLLGAPTAVGFDYDPDAVISARRNVVLNGLTGRVHLFRSRFPETALRAPFPLITANVYFTFFRLYAERLPDLLAPSGRLLASGLQASEGEGEAVRAQLEGLGLPARIAARREGWVLVEAHRP
jgi:ribosomal protein L11 methyltransferase